MMPENFAGVAAKAADDYMNKNLSKVDIEIVNRIRRLIRQGYLNGFRDGYAKRKEETTNGS